MASPVMSAKKQTGKVVEKRGIWLNDSGTISFGLGAEGEILVAQSDYETVKKLSTENRVKYLEAKKLEEKQKAEGKPAAEPAPADKPAETVAKPAEEVKPAESKPPEEKPANP